MIVRILGEGQYDLTDDQVNRLNELDAQVESAVEAGDEPSFREALTRLLDAVRAQGTAHDAATLDASDLILPMPDATLAEVRDMLSDEGLIPG